MNDTTNTLTKTVAGGVFTIELYGWVFDLRWGVGLLLVLMIADLWFGIAESHKKHIDIPKSKCIRRTLNKICDYSAVMMVFLFLGGLMINQPVAGLFVGIAISCFAEGCSVMGHIFYLKGWGTWSWKRFFIALIKFKFKELGTAVEKAAEEVEHQNEQEHGKS